MTIGVLVGVGVDVPLNVAMSSQLDERGMNGEMDGRLEMGDRYRFSSGDDDGGVVEYKSSSTLDTEWERGTVSTGTFRDESDPV